jgi:hypothetical protein
MGGIDGIDMRVVFARNGEAEERGVEEQSPASCPGGRNQGI